MTKSRDEVVEKLRKLHAHQKSAEAIGSEDEAQAFALKLQELLNRHKLDMSDIEWEEHQKENPIVNTFVSHRRGGLKTRKVRIAWMHQLASEIGRAYQVVVCFIHGTADFYYVGEELNGEQARDVYYYMIKVAESLGEKAYVKHFHECKAAGDVTLAQGYKQGFMFGFVTRLRERFREQEKKMEQGAPGTALMRITNAVERANEKLDNDPEVRDIRVSSMAPPKNVQGVMDGIKKADSVKFGAERLGS